MGTGGGSMVLTWTLFGGQFSQTIGSTDLAPRVLNSHQCSQMDCTSCTENRTQSKWFSKCPSPVLPMRVTTPAGACVNPLVSL